MQMCGGVNQNTFAFSNKQRIHLVVYIVDSQPFHYFFCSFRFIACSLTLLHSLSRFQSRFHFYSLSTRKRLSPLSCTECRAFAAHFSCVENQERFLLLFPLFRQSLVSYSGICKSYPKIHLKRLP